MNNKLKLYYDAEFTGLHKNTTLISIGIVSESGNYFYAEFVDYDKDQVNPWIQENVISNLMLQLDHRNVDLIKLIEGKSSNVKICGDKDTIRLYLEYWLRLECHESDSNADKYKQIQFYSDCYAYDWMLLNDLLCKDGNALNLPKYIYYIPMDLSTAFQLNNIDPDITREDFLGNDIIEQMKKSFTFGNKDNFKHNSLWDAYICKLCFDALSKVSLNGIDHYRSQVGEPVNPLDDILDTEVYPGSNTI